MNKMNKKGFTLIEMLVVIAIIAVLVAIIIPIVGSSTEKARAATDAANLRSVKASLTIDALNGTLTQASTATAVPASYKAPASKTDGSAMTYTFKDNVVEVFYNGKNIEHFAGIAGASNAS